MPSCLQQKVQVKGLAEHGRCCLVRASQLYVEDSAFHRLGHGMSDMEHLTRDKPLFQATRNCQAQHSLSSSPGNNCRGVWPQPLGNVCGSPSDERGAQINGPAEAAASVAVHAAAHPVSRFQDSCLHSTPLQIQNNELILVMSKAPRSMGTLKPLPLQLRTQPPTLSLATKTNRPLRISAGNAHWYSPMLKDPTSGL